MVDIGHNTSSFEFTPSLPSCPGRRAPSKACLLRRIGEPGESVWCWLAPGRLDTVLLFGVLCLACQFLFWSRVVQTDNGRSRR